VFVTDQARRELKDLPGNMRQRARKAIDKMTENPRPARSKKLDVPNVAVEARRLRLDDWRIVYAIIEG
jgi:mRNA-degrading endonuclease RelE of RelBE toxin-antitoxin system